MTSSREPDIRPTSSAITAARDVAVDGGCRGPFRGAAAVQWALLATLAAVPAGCAERTSTFDIIDYHSTGQAEHYRETFEEAYYDLDNSGNVDIVLRRRQPRASDPDTDLIQVIHMRSVWRCIPGDTVADRDQINTTVGYHIVCGPVGATFEGAGSLFFKRNESSGTLVGTLDLAHLRPKRRLGTGAPFFERPDLSGQFRARRDGRQVTRIINEMDRVFSTPSLSQPVGRQ